MIQKTESNGHVQKSVQQGATAWRAVTQGLRTFFSQLNSHHDLTAEQWEKLESKPRKASYAPDFRYQKWGH